MPVTLRHMYNSVYAEYDYTANSEADIEEADYSLMKLGKGWKLNIMQSVIESVFQLDGTTYDGYMFLDEYGKKTYLVERIRGPVRRKLRKRRIYIRGLLPKRNSV